MEVHFGVERRRHPRLYEHFPTRVRSVDASGTAFQADTVLNDVSAGGLCVRLVQCVASGATLFAVVRFSTAGDPAAPAPRVAVRGVVLRVEPQPDGRWGVGVQITRHRFLSPLDSV